MRYRILGPLSVTVDKQAVSITAPRDRTVLAMLLSHPGRVVGVEALVDALWGDDPPVTARGQLQTCVSRLRRVLPSAEIGTDPAGYRIEPDPDELDAVCFERLVAEGRARRDPRLYREALDLWRGPALAEIESPAVRRAAAMLDERRLVVAEDWAELELAAGSPRELVAELTALVEQFPLRERLRGLLMTALHRSGRQAEALAEYRRARDVLRDELGIEPGAELSDLHRRILAEPRQAVGVHYLPRTVGDFTGRDEIVRRLVSFVESDVGAGPVIAVIDGMAGSGKSTLALHVAALTGDRYPDAHLFVDLHGHSDRKPVEPAAALLILLRQLGISAERVPDGLGERIDLWRTELAARRALILLDNAASSAQVADLLPASPGTLALVTTRRRLAGLDGAYHESLPVLSEPDAVTMLARIAGDRVAAEPAAAAELVRRCGALPLALRLAGTRLAHRPGWRVADLVRRIGSSALPELAAEKRTVAGAFTLSFSQLPESARDVFRLMGLHPGASFDTPAAAALADLSLDNAEKVLEDLVDVHLVEEPEPGVFRLHDLLREYASALAAELPEADRHAAVVRALDFELHAALATVPPPRRRQVVIDLYEPVPARPDLLDALTDPAARLERIRPVLGAMLDTAVSSGRPEYAWMLPRAAWRYLWSRGYIDDIRALTTVSRDVARQVGDPIAQAMAANYLASTFYLRGQFEQARVLLDESVRLREGAGDLRGLGNALANLSAVQNTSGRFAEAAVLAERALDLAMQFDDGISAELRLDSLSGAYSALGRHAEAVRLQRRRLLYLIEVGDRAGVAQVFVHLVRARRRAGDIAPEIAERMLRLAVRRMVGNQYLTGEADARADLGDLLRERGRYAEARSELRLSLAKMSEVGDSREKPRMINMLARVHAEAGDAAEAETRYREALATARRTGQAFEEAQALLGLGERREAHEIFTRLGVPEAELAGVDHLRSSDDGGTMDA